MVKNRIGLFGGSFNPPTKAHLYVAEQLIERGIVDEVQFVPAYVSYHHKEYEATPQQRCDMIRLMIDESKFGHVLYVNDFEITNQMQSSTYDFVGRFLETKIDDYTDTEYYFIVGGDNAKKVPNFINGEELIKAIPFIVVNRSNVCVEEIEWCSKEPHIVVNLGNDHSGCSSTKIREVVKNFGVKDTPKEFFNWCSIRVFAYILNSEIYMETNENRAKDIADAMKNILDKISPDNLSLLSAEERECGEALQDLLDWQEDYSDVVTWAEFKDNYSKCDRCGYIEHNSYGQCICYAR